MDNNPNSTFSAFPELKVLKLSSSHELRGWEDLNPEEDANHANNVMPKIEILEFEDCSKFHELPRQLLRQASSLKKLLIRTGQLSFGIDFKDIADGVDGVLYLHHGFQRLRMTVKSSTEVPTSIIYPSYIKMLDLYCEEPISYLPPMGKLPYLESLTITDFSSLKVIGRELLGINDHNNEAEFVSFNELVKLEIDSCTLLEGWEDLKPEDEGRITVMPKLEAIRIRGCKKFTKLPFWLHLKLSSLKELESDDGNFILQSEQLRKWDTFCFTTVSIFRIFEHTKVRGYKITQLVNVRGYNKHTRVVVNRERCSLPVD